ncbi:unnamed protein product [Sphenostylis stenocarpa]|uniref:Uncharacterized protein n=1 Tax=Sphenostylis stenocarpa TaxID=92480 RepID=A0AA86T8I7_9FABA|nr:unnamed protein product [Sphenostylis stenocarpa]
MGSTMRPTIFNERVAMTLRNWHTVVSNKKLRRQLSKEDGRKKLGGNAYLGCGRCLLRFALHIHLHRAHLPSHRKELMLLGFISLLLTVGQSVISRICISEKVAGTFHPCANKREHKPNGRRLLSEFFGSDDNEIQRRILASGGSDKCAAQGKVPFVSSEGIHQLHIFIFVLAVFHVLYCILTLALGRAKMRRWKGWEEETKTAQYQFSHDPERFRFARETSFGRRHLSFWTQYTVLVWIICFFRQFVRSVPKVDYLTLRHGFLTAHLGPQSHQKFDFRQYIKRTLEEDFKVVVEIRFCA